MVDEFCRVVRVWKEISKFEFGNLRSCVQFIFLSVFLRVCRPRMFGICYFETFFLSVTIKRRVNMVERLQFYPKPCISTLGVKKLVWFSNNPVKPLPIHEKIASKNIFSRTKIQSTQIHINLNPQKIVCGFAEPSKG